MIEEAMLKCKSLTEEASGLHEGIGLTFDQVNWLWRWQRTWLYWHHLLWYHVWWSVWIWVWFTHNWVLLWWWEGHNFSSMPWSEDAICEGSDCKQQWWRIRTRTLQSGRFSLQLYRGDRPTCRTRFRLWMTATGAGSFTQWTTINIR